MGKRLKTTVIVPTRKNEQRIIELLDSLREQKEPPDQIVIVVDAPGHEEIGVPPRYNTKIIYTGSHRGANYARNLGVKEASGDILVFVDSHCKAPPDWTRHLLYEFEDEDTYAVAGTVKAANEYDFFARYQEHSFIKPTPKYEKRMRLRKDIGLRIVTTANMAVRRKAFKAVGGFDPIYEKYGNDDTDFAYRMIKAGYPIACSPTPIIYHYNRTSMKEIVKRYFQHGEGFSILKSKHPRSTFTILVSLGVYGFVLNYITSFLFLLLAPIEQRNLSIISTIAPLILLFLYHLRGLIKHGKLERLTYPFLDFILTLSSVAGVLCMDLKILKKSMKRLFTPLTTHAMLETS